MMSDNIFCNIHVLTHLAVIPTVTSPTITGVLIDPINTATPIQTGGTRALIYIWNSYINIANIAQQRKGIVE